MELAIGRHVWGVECCGSLRGRQDLWAFVILFLSGCRRGNAMGGKTWGKTESNDGHKCRRRNRLVTVVGEVVSGVFRGLCIAEGW